MSAVNKRHVPAGRKPDPLPSGVSVLGSSPGFDGGGPSALPPVLDFLVQSLVTVFRLKQPQAMQLLSNNAKDFSSLLIFGLRKDFEPVLKWYQFVNGQVGVCCWTVHNQFCCRSQRLFN